MCHLESGYPSLPDLVTLKKTLTFLERCGKKDSIYLNDDPLSFAMNRIMNANLEMGKNINNMIREDIPDMSVLMERVRNNVRESAASRSMVYRDINPALTSPDINIRQNIILTSFTG